MSDIVNLRRVRKAKVRAEAAAMAEANRIKHSVAKPVRNLAKARDEKERREIEAHRLEDKG